MQPILLQIILPPLIAVLLFCLSVTPHNFWFFAYIALVPLFIQIISAKSSAVSRYSALTFGLLVYGWNLRWFANIFGTIASVLWLILAMFIMFFAVILRALSNRFGNKIALILSPFLWVGIEFFRSELWALKFGWN